MHDYLPLITHFCTNLTYPSFPAIFFLPFESIQRVSISTTANAPSRSSEITIFLISLLILSIHHPPFKVSIANLLSCLYLTRGSRGFMGVASALLKAQDISYFFQILLR